MSSRTHIQEGGVVGSITLEIARVCIHRIPHESSITASAGRGITLDQRHAAADQINSIVSRAKEK
jgi:hypothetical protein